MPIGSSSMATLHATEPTSPCPITRAFTPCMAPGLTKNTRYFLPPDVKDWSQQVLANNVVPEQSVPVEQFFETDYHPLQRDLNHWVLDEATQVRMTPSLLGLLLWSTHQLWPTHK